MCTPSGEEIYTETINIVVTATSRNKYAEASDEITKSCTVIGACSKSNLLKVYKCKAQESTRT